MKTKIERRKCIVFARVSSKRQINGEEGNSIEQQIKACSKYATDLGFEKIRVIKATESAQNEGPKFKEMIRVAKSGNYDAIIVQYLDRFSRKTWVIGKYAEELRKQSIYIHAVHEGLNTEEEASLFATNIFATFAQQENLRRKERTINSNISKLLDGFWVHQPPIGYQRNRNTKLIEQSSKSIFIQQAFRMILNNYTVKTIKNDLDIQGFRHTYKRWNAILKNPFYCGILESTYLQGLNVKPKGRHNPLISVDDFDRVQKILNKKKVTKKKEIECNYVLDLSLRTILLCPKCNKGVTAYSKNKGPYQYFYYKCASNCKYNINAALLNEHFVQNFAQCKLQNSLIPTFKNRVSTLYDKFFYDKLERLRRIKANIKLLETKDGKLYEDYLSGFIDRAKYSELSANFKNDIQTFSVELQNLDVLDKTSFIDVLMHLLLNIHELWLKANPEQKKRLQKLIFEQGLTFDKEIKMFKTFIVSKVYSYPI